MPYSEIARAVIRDICKFLEWKCQEESEKSKKAAERRKDESKPPAPGQKYSHYRHPTEEEHRTAEQFSWRDSYALNICIGVVAILTLGFAAGTYCQTRRQANIAQATLIAVKEPDVHFAGMKDLHESLPDIPLNTVASAIQWKNDGGGGTRHLRWLTACAVSTTLDQALSIIDARRKVIAFQPSFLSAAQESGGGRCIVEKEGIARVNAGKATLFVYGEARYYGELDPKKLKMTEFTFATHHIDLINDAMNADFLGVGDRNCQDEDCPNYPKQDNP